jgi:hypothetical protein
MLKIWIGDVIDDNEDYIYAPQVYFNYRHEPEWIISEFGRRVIEGVDKAEVIDVDCIKSPILGMISVEKIAGGTKALIMMNFDDEHIYNASSCGDNCAKYILEIAQRKDLTIRLGHIMHFPTKEVFDGVILNNGIEFHSQKEFVLAYSEV